MTPQLKSLNTGILKCAKSEFVKNIGNPNDVIAGCQIVLNVNASLKDNIIEGFKTGFDVPFTSYVVVPTADGRFTFYIAPDLTTSEGLDLWINTFSTSFANELVQIFWVGRNIDPHLAIIQDSLETSQPNQIFVMTPVVSQHTGNCFSVTLYYDPDITTDGESFILLACDCTLKRGNIKLISSANLYVNGQLTLEEGAISVSGYDAPEECANVYLVPQEHPENIAANAFEGNINHLEYHGEWNQTTRAWFHGSIYYLNGEPLDPIPNK